MLAFKARHITDTNINHGLLIVGEDRIVFTTEGRSLNMTEEALIGLIDQFLELSGPVYTFAGGPEHLVFPYHEITRYGVVGGTPLSAFQSRLMIEHGGCEYYFAFQALSPGSPDEVKQILDHIYGN
jgi:hypothetical protein